MRRSAAARATSRTRRFPVSRATSIAGHRDTTFRALRRIHLGDTLEFKTADRVYRYRISKTWIVGPDDVYVLDPTPQPALTLVTCYPFEFVGHAPNRFIVRAELVGEETVGTR